MRRRRKSLGSARLAPTPKMSWGLGDEVPAAPAKRTRGRTVVACGPTPSQKNRIQLCMRVTTPGRQVSNHTSACEALKAEGAADRESFYTMLLDTRHNLIGVEEVAKGSLNGVEVHPREVFKSAVLANAAAMLIAHNHPSGNSSPSRQDIELTGRLIDAGKMMGIPILDHVILTRDGCHSMRSSGSTSIMFDGAAKLGHPRRPRRGQFVR